MHSELSTAARSLAVIVVVGLLGGILLVIATGVFAQLAGVSNESLTREPQVVLDGPAYVGAMSNLGVLAFSLAAVSSGLAATVVTGRERAMFVSAAVVTSLMMFDDLYLLHDVVYPRAGIPEIAVEFAYLVVIGAIVLRHRGELGAMGLVGVTLTVGLWAFSVFMDTFLNNHELNLDQLVEDGAKFVGIVVWGALWAGLAHNALRHRVQPTHT